MSFLPYQHGCAQGSAKTRSPYCSRIFRLFAVRKAVQRQDPLKRAAANLPPPTALLTAKLSDKTFLSVSVRVRSFCTIKLPHYPEHLFYCTKNIPESEISAKKKCYPKKVTTNQKICAIIHSQHSAKRRRENVR